MLAGKVVPYFVVSSFLLVLALGCQSSAQPSENSGPTPAQVAEDSERQQAAAERAAAEAEADEERAREQAERITDEDLAVFAAGIRALAEREQEMKDGGRDFETRRQTAASPPEVIEIEQQTLAEMEEALEEVGLEFEGFMMMAQFVRQNPILMQRLGDHLDEEEIKDFYGAR